MNTCGLFCFSINFYTHLRSERDNQSLFTTIWLLSSKDLTNFLRKAPSQNNVFWWIEDIHRDKLHFSLPGSS